MATKPRELQAENGSGSPPQNGQPPAGSAPAKRIARLRVLAGESIARRPALLRVLEWLSRNNPGGSINP